MIMPFIGRVSWFYLNCLYIHVVQCLFTASISDQYTLQRDTGNYGYSWGGILPAPQADLSNGTHAPLERNSQLCSQSASPSHPVTSVAQSATWSKSKRIPQRFTFYRNYYAVSGAENLFMKYTTVTEDGKLLYLVANSRTTEDRIWLVNLNTSHSIFTPKAHIVQVEQRFGYVFLLTFHSQYLRCIRYNSQLTEPLTICSMIIQDKSRWIYGDKLMAVYNDYRVAILQSLVGKDPIFLQIYSLEGVHVQSISLYIASHANGIWWFDKNSVLLQFSSYATRYISKELAAYQLFGDQAVCLWSASVANLHYMTTDGNGLIYALIAVPTSTTYNSITILGNYGKFVHFYKFVWLHPLLFAVIFTITSCLGSG